MSERFQSQTDLGGLITILPEDKIPNRNATDILNIDLSLPGLIQTGGGYSEFADQLTATGTNLRGYLFKKNYGTISRILLRVRDDGSNSIVEWLNTKQTGANQDGKWSILKGGLTAGKVMGFTPFNNSNANNIVMCNGEDNYMSWNGATASIASTTSNSITANESSLVSEGFASSGSVTIDGNEYAYTSISGNTFNGVTPDPSGESANDGIAQVVTEYASMPKGNVLLTAGARVWIAGIKDKGSQLQYTDTGDHTTITIGSSPSDGGIEDFPDGGGNITLLDSKDGRRIIVHKEDGLLVFSLDYTSTAKIPNLDTITLADDSGASNLKAGAGINNVSYFTSRIEGIKSLRRAIEGSELNSESITDVILPTIQNYDLSEASAVYYPKQRVIYVACKSSDSVATNDRVIAYFIRRTAQGAFVGDLSIFTIPVADWILERNNLYFLSSLNQNVYKMFDKKSANGVGMKHVWTSKAFSFGDPAQDKEFEVLYVDGFIGQGTKLKITVFYGILGLSDSNSVILEWDDNTYVYDKKVSALGTEVLGSLPLGDLTSGLLDSYAFSVPIHFDVNKANRFKIKFETLYDDETSSESYWAIANYGFDPKTIGINTNRVKNSN